jgi:hypothetical protein
MGAGVLCRRHVFVPLLQHERTLAVTVDYVHPLSLPSITENFSSIIVISLVVGETTCPKSPSLAAAALLFT